MYGLNQQTLPTGILSHFPYVPLSAGAFGIYKK